MRGGYRMGFDPSTTTASTTAVWNQWIVQGPRGAVGYYNTTTPTTTSANIVWDQWRDVGYNTTGVVWQEEIWGRWERDEEQLAEMQRQRDELQARREQQSRERLAREQELMENRLVAHSRAVELLDALLTEEERADRLQTGKITVQGSDGRLYWIETHRESVHGNIVLTDEHGCMLGRACVAPSMRGESGVLPTPDGWVGQYLGLKFDARQFLSHANWSNQGYCRRPAEQAA